MLSSDDYAANIKPFSGEFFLFRHCGRIILEVLWNLYAYSLNSLAAPDDYVSNDRISYSKNIEIDCY